MNDICKMRRCAILHKNDVIDVIPCRYHVILKHLQIAFCIHCIATRGRRGPHVWPAFLSPDLTPCDFFLWGWAKDEVYRTKPRTLEQLEARIQYVINNIHQKTVDSIP
ncbi:hypothetical protein C0J52_14475 [Blattella germanica]|nr:hypothetical protein C0J52_14475 [Blattella germanica]